jgi:hypothetical protein
MSAEFGSDQAIYGRKTGTYKPDTNLNGSVYFISKMETKVVKRIASTYPRYVQ